MFRSREERGYGTPLSDPQRIARHYNITVEEACNLLKTYSVEELLPERGYGLTHTQVGVSHKDCANFSYPNYCILKNKEVNPDGPACPDFQPVHILTGTSQTDLARCLNTMENSLAHGGKARLDLATYQLPAKMDLDTMWADMVASGLHVSKPTAKIVQGVPLTTMVLTKGSPAWAALIPLLVPLAIIGLIAFGITKIETITKALLPVIIATGVVTIVGLGLIRQPAVKYLERAAK